MLSLANTRLVLAALMAANSAVAFQPARPVVQGKTSLSMVAVDPEVVTKKDYEDICGTSFDEAAMHDRLKSTKFLYPKHVEVIEDISPIAGAMVDEIVRASDLR